ncbi:hypothetical protein JVU11DRAFT_1146 [Chiua virens]|nr:hypothetical protein JVU11DRAFT_1146 [Chiua virens]
MAAISGGDLFQNAVYVGINLEGILYGVELVLYFMTMHRLLAHEGQRTTSDVFYAVFSSVMLLNVTIWISTQASFGQHMWLLNADFPGGPNAYWAAHISDWTMELGTTAMVVLQLMTDGLMIYRCWMVWNSYRIIIVPSIVWIVTLVLGIAVIWVNSTKGGIEFQTFASQICMAYYGVATPLTVILTSMICYRMLWFGRQLEAHLGHEYASPYFAIVSLVVEDSDSECDWIHPHVDDVYITADVDPTRGNGDCVDARDEQATALDAQILASKHDGRDWIGRYQGDFHAGVELHSGRR